MTFRRNMQKGLTFVVNLFYLLLMVTTLIGAVTILDQRIHVLSKKGIFLVDALILVLILAFLFRHQLVSWTKKLMANRRAKITLIVIGMILLVGWQLSCVYYLTGWTFLDPVVIGLTVTKHKIGSSAYFSNYPNNVFLLYIWHYIWIIFGRPNFKNLFYLINTINLILVDSGIFIFRHLVGKIMNKRSVNLATFFYIACFAVLPLIVIPYSDVPSLFIGLLSINCLLNILINKPSSLTEYCVAGILLALGYLIKPSTVIIYIAFIFIFILYKHGNWKRLLLNLGAFMLIALGTLFIGNAINHSNKLVHVNHEMAFSMWHFCSYGLIGNGGYNYNEVLDDAKIPTYNAKKRHDITKVKQRLRAMGIHGYQQFLFNKQEKNSSDGTLGWGQEGHNFITSFRKPKVVTRSLPGKIFTNGTWCDRFHGGFEVLTQLVWIVMILGLLAAMMENNEIMIFIKLGIVGFSLFLLIFEGGRSRYLIQFLPLMFMASAAGWLKISNLIHKNTVQ